MFNTKKIFGIIIALIGVVLTKVTFSFEAGSSQAFFLKIAGVLIACTGIAVFAGGIRNKIEKKIRICHHCYKKNDAENALCRSCKKPLETPIEK